MTTLTLQRDCLLTSNQRHGHWATRARLTSYLRARSRALHRGQPQYQRAALTVTVTWADRRRRDASNLQPTIKALIDGAIDAGILPDDSDRHLTALTITANPEPHRRPGVVLIDLQWTGGHE